METDSIAAAVKGTFAWVKETGKEVGGVIAAAGVSTPAKVCGSQALVQNCFFQRNLGKDSMTRWPICGFATLHVTSGGKGLIEVLSSLSKFGIMSQSLQIRIGY